MLQLHQMPQYFVSETLQSPNYQLENFQIFFNYVLKELTSIILSGGLPYLQD